MLLMALLAVSCTDEITEPGNNPEEEKNTGEQVLFTSGTTENSAMTRAATYYMEPGSRFVCNMYFKTDDSGDRYNLERGETAWLKVEDWKSAEASPLATPGNSLYWNNSYAAATKFDKNRNDDLASIFYWQNRREHAFVAWTDLNKIDHSGWNEAGGLNMDFTSSDDKYAYKTGNKTSKYVSKGYYVHNSAQKFANESAAYAYVKADYLSDQTTLFTEAAQTVQKENLLSLYGDLSNVNFYSYRYDQDHGYYAKRASRTVESDQKRNVWEIVCFFDQDHRLVYNLPEYDADETEPTPKYITDEEDHTYLVDKEGNKVAERVEDSSHKYLKELDSTNRIAQIVTAEDGTEQYYQCNPYGYILYDENYIKGWVCMYDSEVLETVDEVLEIDAKRFDLRSSASTNMSQQPDVLMAFTKDKIPTSAVMQNNRVELVFQHQFSQVQVNLLSSSDSEDLKIEADQIESVVLLGVSDYGYIFPYLIYGREDDSAAGSEEVAMVRPSTFKEVVATDYTDAQLEENPYGTRFDMYERTLSADDKNVKKYVKSYEGITFGRLQAIRITWHENYSEEQGRIKHISTFRVPETNDMQQPLRLLQSGTKYIWNMELRRGTLAVIQTEIIPWIENEEPYNADGLIVKPASGTSTNP